MFSWNLKGTLKIVNNPLVMGILNITPDSFYAGSRLMPEYNWLTKAEKMISDGADILDIGGQSTRPGSERIGMEEEMNRIIPVIKKLRQQFPEIILSVDTYQSVVAKKAVEAGANMVNDISGGEMDPEMLKVVGNLSVPYICMHMQGKPENMQKAPYYENIISELLDFFQLKKVQCRDAGIHDLILDPGFGFGKTTAHNFQVLHNLSVFKMTGLPIMAGLSRKSMVYKTLDITPEEALNGTTVLNTIALMQGADILRVHDVKEAKDAIILIGLLESVRPGAVRAV
ncbi:MAG: dihydropteroate synthase [Chitinophagaceae bacterium]